MVCLHCRLCNGCSRSFKTLVSLFGYLGKVPLAKVPYEALVLTYCDRNIAKYQSSFTKRFLPNINQALKYCNTCIPAFIDSLFLPVSVRTASCSPLCLSLRSVVHSAWSSPSWPPSLVCQFSRASCWNQPVLWSTTPRVQYCDTILGSPLAHIDTKVRSRSTTAL